MTGSLWCVSFEGDSHDACHVMFPLSFESFSYQKVWCSSLLLAPGFSKNSWCVDEILILLSLSSSTCRESAVGGINSMCFPTNEYFMMMMTASWDFYCQKSHFSVSLERNVCSLVKRKARSSLYFCVESMFLWLMSVIGDGVHDSQLTHLFPGRDDHQNRKRTCLFSFLPSYFETLIH